jgi:hypothetical protein
MLPPEIEHRHCPQSCTYREYGSLVLPCILYYASGSGGGGRSRQRGKKKELFSFEEEGIDILLYK